MVVIKFKCKENIHTNDEASYVIIKSKKSIPGVTTVKRSKAKDPDPDWEFRGECGDGHVHFYKYRDRIKDRIEK